MMTPPSQDSVYLHDASTHTLSTALSSLTPFSSLPPADQALFKSPPSDAYILTTDRTIFYPQGGGQPSDTGTITTTSPASSFTVSLVRSSASKPTKVLHCGTFAPSEPFADKASLTQNIDAEKRNLHSRWHTAGHILAVAAHQILPGANLVDGKASHTPGSASIEFSKGTIPADAKDAIVARANEMVKGNTSVNIHWWDANTMRARCIGGCEGLEGMLAGNVEDGDSSGLLRAVEIEGVGSYPCGGTHLPRTSDIGKIEIRKIARKGGVCRVSYLVV